MSTEKSSPEKSRYMGRDVNLVTAPNGAITNTEVLQNLAALLSPNSLKCLTRQTTTRF